MISLLVGLALGARLTHNGINSSPILQGQAQTRKPSLTGHIEKIADFSSKVLNNKRNLIIYLPPDYSSSANRRYPVVYMHDGQNIFDGSTSYIPNEEWRADEAAEGLINAGIIEPVIIVGIDNAGADRANEYLPMTVKMGGQSSGGRADSYGKMITEELMPVINSKYRTKVGPKNTALIGSSFGGVISLYLGTTHPETFGLLGVVSPSTWVGNGLDAYVKPLKLKPKIWLDMGESESPTSVADAKKLFNTLISNGWKERKEAVLYIDGHAGHNERAWSGRIGSILTYLFPRK